MNEDTKQPGAYARSGAATGYHGRQYGRCKSCGDGWYIGTGVVALSDPPQDEAKCNKCGSAEYMRRPVYPVTWLAHDTDIAQ